VDKFVCTRKLPDSDFLVIAARSYPLGQAAENIPEGVIPNERRFARPRRQTADPSLPGNRKMRRLLESSG
jgi:hypothetical protein